MKSLTPDNLQSGFADCDFIKRIVFFEETTSTNTAAADGLKRGVYPPDTLIVADYQSGGKGRQGRKWLSPRGSSLLFSLIVKPEIPLDKISFLTLLSGVAAANAVNSVSPLHCSIKWPNDLIVNEKKIGGILVETVFNQGDFLGVVIGIGINVHQEKTDIPDEIKEIASSINIEQKEEIPFSRIDILKEIINNFYKLYNIWLKKGPKQILNNWKKLSITIGKQVIIQSHQGKEHAEAIDIENDGGLVVRDDNGFIKKIFDSEIEFIRFDK